MVGVLIIFTAFGLVVWGLYAAIRAWGDIEPAWWQPLVILGAGRGLGKALLLILPEIDSITRLGLGLILYLLVVGGMLTFWTKVPPVRSLSVALATWIFFIIAAFIAVPFIDAGKP